MIGLRATTRPPLALLRPTRGGQPLPGPRVYLVDDNVGLRASLRALLADAGVEVVGEAGDAGQALRQIPPLAYTAPVVALMDVRMPGPANGIEATRLLIDRCQAVAVIMFTAFPSEAIERAARNAGAVAFLVKGVSGEAIVSAIHDAWAGVRVGC